MRVPQTEYVPRRSTRGQQANEEIKEDPPISLTGKRAIKSSLAKSIDKIGMSGNSTKKRDDKKNDKEGK
jgi:hypothetical protein